MKKKLKKLATGVMALVMIFSVGTITYAATEEAVAPRATYTKKWDVYAGTPYGTNATTVSFTCGIGKDAEVYCGDLTIGRAVSVESRYITNGPIKPITSPGHWRDLVFSDTYLGKTVSVIMSVTATDKPTSATGWINY